MLSELTSDEADGQGWRQRRLTDPEVQAEPWVWYAALREHAPVWRDAATGFWIVTSMALCRQVLGDPASFSSKLDQAALRGGGLPAEVEAIRAEGVRPVDTLLTNDPPGHRRYRALVEHVFRPARVAALEPAIRAEFEGLLNAVAPQGACDAVAELAAPLPVAIIADQLGFAPERRGDVKRWSDAISELRGLMGAPERLADCARAQNECFDFLLAESERRRRDPDDSILSDVANARLDDGRPLEPGELVSILVQLMVAGNESTSNTLAAAVRILALDPALQTRLRTGDARVVRGFVEEVLRMESAVQGQMRVAKRDVAVGGVTVPAGALVSLRYGAANRDPAAFAEPERFDPRRSGGAAHLSFGAGAHFCVGAALARRELNVAVRMLLDRLHDIRLVEPNQPPEYAPSFHLRGLVRLPIAFRAR